MYYNERDEKGRFVKKAKQCNCKKCKDKPKKVNRKANITEDFYTTTNISDDILDRFTEDMISLAADYGFLDKEGDLTMNLCIKVDDTVLLTDDLVIQVK